MSVTKPIFSLVYISASAHLLSNEELDEILAVSRRNNIRLGITGMPLYYEGGFISRINPRWQGAKPARLKLGQRAIGGELRESGGDALLQVIRAQGHGNDIGIAL